MAEECANCQLTLTDGVWLAVVMGGIQQINQLIQIDPKYRAYARHISSIIPAIAGGLSGKKEKWRHDFRGEKEGGTKSLVTPLARREVRQNLI